nr:hypothetical protein MIMGU_mgv1a0222732mg [Ipomoea batatas]
MSAQTAMINKILLQVALRNNNIYNPLKAPNGFLVLLLELYEIIENIPHYYGLGQVIEIYVVAYGNDQEKPIFHALTLKTHYYNYPVLIFVLFSQLVHVCRNPFQVRGEGERDFSIFGDDSGDVDLRRLGDFLWPEVLSLVGDLDLTRFGDLLRLEGFSLTVINTQVLKHHHILHLHLPPFAAPPVQSPLPHGVSPLERHHGRAALLDGAPHFPERFPDSLHGEVQDRHGPPHRERRLVIGQSRLLCFVEGSQPNPYPVPRRIPYLRRELPPRPPPHAAVRLLRSLRGHLLFLSRRRLRQNPEEEHFFGVINVEREGAVEIPAIPREIFRR